MTGDTGIWVWLANLDARIWQAVIAGAFLAAGWMVNGWQNRRSDAREADQTRQEAADLRAERLRDVHRALYAEIGANLANLSREDALVAEAEAVIAKMEADKRYTPFLPREHRDTVFRSVVRDIHVLPRTTIDAIVAYYAQLTSISALIDDIRGTAYANLPSDRKIAIYSDLIKLKQQALAFGDYALLMIKTYAEGGPEAAKALDLKMKNSLSIQPVADRSVQ